MSEVENPTKQEIHDPVCHMDLPANETAGSIEHNGFTYYFCSDECMWRFQADPEAVLQIENQHTHSV